MNNISSLNGVKKLVNLTYEQGKDIYNKFGELIAAVGNGISGANSWTGLQTFLNGIATDTITEKTSLANITVLKALINKHLTTAQNSTVTLTAAQVKTGYVTCVS